MSTENEPEPKTLTASAVLSLGGASVPVRLTVPKGSVDLAQLLPTFRSLAETIIDHSVEVERSRGLTVSCRKGCGACCRQLVPISEIEARQLRDLVDDLPEPRRTEIRDRFAAARRRLDEAGFLETLENPDRFLDPTVNVNDLGLRYFRLALPCPFLDEEACSIHPERPIACREYLVTTPAENCSTPSAETVRCVPLPGKVSQAVTRIGVEPPRRTTRWVALSLALDWAETHPDDLPPRPGPEWLGALMSGLTGREIPPALS